MTWFRVLTPDEVKALYAANPYKLFEVAKWRTK